ncbi:MAG TPA: alanine dehydrogenase [Iamia sp.]|nr:alanine dehydrogenase [Iamia sp.]
MTTDRTRSVPSPGGSSVGIVRETKDGERRVALDPRGVGALVAGGCAVRIEAGAGLGSGFADDAYSAAGAVVVGSAAEAWAAEVVVKVKEPQPDEWAHFRPGLRLFCFLHLAAEPDLLAALRAHGVSAYAFETLEGSGSVRLPVLAPMSEIAGRVAAIVGPRHLADGSGVLVGGAAGVPPANVTVIGLGVAGTAAARGCRGLDAVVTGVDVDLDRLRAAAAGGVVDRTMASDRVAEAVAEADLVVGAALVPGAAAPVVVTEEMVRSMRPGSVVVDLAIDQGGCVATSRPTSHSAPTYWTGDVLHYCVTNVPGQYPRTSSHALSSVVAPYVAALAEGRDEMLPGAINVLDGRVVHPVVAAATR